jgi:hypothetical protein
VTQFRGDKFILDSPAGVPAVWGADSDVLWAEGEPLMVVAGDGAGKTTLAGQLALARIGIGGELLGLPITEGRGVLYVAADRPRQIQRSFRRMVDEGDRKTLHDRLAFWKGPLPFDVACEPERLLEFVQNFAGVDTLIVDSLKDVAMRLTEDETGAAVNHAIQCVIAADIEVVVLHHQRKQTGDRKAREIADVYGSRWLTAGMGSVVALWGNPGDAIVELRHLKQPADPVGPLALIHDHDAGTTAIHDPVDLLTFVRDAGTNGRTVRDVAEALEPTAEVDRNTVERARRRLTKLASGGLLVEFPASAGQATTFVYNGGAA